MSQPIVRSSLSLLLLPVLTWSIGCAETAVPTDLIDELADAGVSETTQLVAAVDETVMRVLANEFAAESDPEVEAELTVDSTVVDETFEEVPQVSVTESAVSIPEDEAFTAPAPEGLPLLSGTLRGRYAPVPRRSNQASDSNDDRSRPARHVGRFRGEWMNDDGTLSGHFHGHYVELRRNELPDTLVAGGVFRGIYVGNGGEVRGFLRGRYGHSASGEGHFVGRWLDPDDHLIGGLRGRWQDDPNAPGGMIAGRWVQFDVCREADSLPEFEFDPNDLGGLDAEDVPPVPEDVDLTLAEPAADVAPAHPPICNLEADAFFRGRYHPHRRDPNDPNAMRRPGGRLRAAWVVPDGRNLALRGKYVPFPPADPNDPNFVPPERPDPNDPNFVPPDPNDPNAPHPPRRAVLLGRWYAKLVDRAGETQGYVRGVYGLSGRRVGVLRAEWLDLDVERIGVLKGHWLVTPRRPGGPFRGAAFLIEPELAASNPALGAPEGLSP